MADWLESEPTLATPQTCISPTKRPRCDPEIRLKKVSRPWQPVISVPIHYYETNEPTLAAADRMICTPDRVVRPITAKPVSRPCSLAAADKMANTSDWKSRPITMKPVSRPWQLQIKWPIQQPCTTTLYYEISHLGSCR